MSACRPLMALLLAPAFVVGCSDPVTAPVDDGGAPADGRFVPPPVVDSGFGPRADTGGGAGGAAGDGGVADDGGGGTGGAPPERQPHCDPANREQCNDIDDDCDLIVDEGCTCTLPEKPCYSGHPADLDGSETACRAGVQACRIEFYGPCEGEVGPADEACNGVDDDCDGITDELEDCRNRPPTAICPDDLEGPPLADYRLAGGYDDPEGQPMARAEWRIVEQPGGSTAAPRPAMGLDTVMFADLQGGYLLELTVEDSEGGIGRCTTRITTRTRDGLRIEMVWNVNAVGDTSDVDLHLKRAPDADWFDEGARGDDCFYRNCKVCGGFDEDACRAELAAFNADPNRDPPPQVEWSAPLSADDPRLDLDDVEGLGPENINILTPRAGIYRLGVHYYEDDGFGASTVTVRIFCGGELARAFDPIALEPTGSRGGPATEFWEVADIVWQGDGCRVDPLGAPGCPLICTQDEALFGGCRPGRTRGRACP